MSVLKSSRPIAERSRASTLTWRFLETFKVPDLVDPYPPAWSGVSAWADRASRAVDEAEHELSQLLVWWNERLADLGGDPSKVDWETFRPLRLSREEGWSDWLAFLLETSRTGLFARALFGASLRDCVADFSGPKVEREPWTASEDRRGDLVIAWRGDAVSHVEVKIRDASFDKTYETARGLASAHGNPKDWSDYVLIAEEALADWRNCAKRHPNEREIGEILWLDVALALRSSMLAPEPQAWRAWAWTFAGAIEQKLLGHRYHAPGRRLPASPSSFKAILNRIDLLRRAHKA